MRTFDLFGLENYGNHLSTDDWWSDLWLYIGKKNNFSDTKITSGVIDNKIHIYPYEVDKITKKLDEELRKGRTQKYCTHQWTQEYPDVTCPFCKGTGHSSLPKYQLFEEGHEYDKCICHGTGKIKPWKNPKRLKTKNVRRFLNFLKKNPKGFVVYHRYI